MAACTTEKSDGQVISDWKVRTTKWAENTTNPLRKIVESMKIEPNPEKELIRLSIGDPAVYGNLPPSQLVLSAVTEQVKSGVGHGYCFSYGLLAARQAVAECHSSQAASYTADDVYLASGCSGALDLAIRALADRGDNILAPCPGFSLYRCLAEAFEIEVRTYLLNPEKGWEADLEHMVSQINEKTKVIIVNNPSNPCGSVYSREHLEAIAEVARRYRLPIISDEVYAFMAFHGTQFFSMAEVAPDQPVLTCGGLAKRYLVPGWRMGWVMVHDKDHVVDDVRFGLRSLSTQILGPCSLIQAALPAILRETPQEFFDNTIRHCEEAARLTHRLLSEVPALNPVMPHGAMYMMVGINPSMIEGVENDIQFTERLLAEESVFCLPGQCFEFPNFVRVVLSAPLDMLSQACGRIEEFCCRHAIQA